MKTIAHNAPFRNVSPRPTRNAVAPLDPATAANTGWAKPKGKSSAETMAPWTRERSSVPSSSGKVAIRQVWRIAKATPTAMIAPRRGRADDREEE